MLLVEANLWIHRPTGSASEVFAHLCLGPSKLWGSFSGHGFAMDVSASGNHASPLAEVSRSTGSAKGNHASTFAEVSQATGSAKGSHASGSTDTNHASCSAKGSPSACVSVRWGVSHHDTGKACTHRSAGLTKTHVSMDFQLYQCHGWHWYFPCILDRSLLQCWAFRPTGNSVDPCVCKVFALW